MPSLPATEVPPSDTGMSVPPLLFPDEPDKPISMGNEVAIRAIALIGAPYRFGGGGPNAFDCSGLVRYVYQEIGIDVPRTVSEQLSSAERVSLEDLRPGDLLFFKIGHSRISHVAIYTGENRFVHAPQTGRPVEIRSFDDSYYRPRLVRAGRFR
jgi:murein DD-endopeptidase